MRATMERLKRRMGVRAAREVFRRLARWSGHRVAEEVADGAAVNAAWDGERWVAVCECGGAEVVAGPEAPREEQVFFCCSCGNEGVGRRWRPVVYPDMGGV